MENEVPFDYQLFNYLTDWNDGLGYDASSADQFGVEGTKQGNENGGGMETLEYENPEQGRANTGFAEAETGRVWNFDLESLDALEARRNREEELRLRDLQKWVSRTENLLEQWNIHPSMDMASTVDTGGGSTSTGNQNLALSQFGSTQQSSDDPIDVGAIKDPSSTDTFFSQNSSQVEQNIQDYDQQASALSIPYLPLPSPCPTSFGQVGSTRFTPLISPNTPSLAGTPSPPSFPVQSSSEIPSSLCPVCPTPPRSLFTTPCNGHEPPGGFSDKPPIAFGLGADEARAGTTFYGVSQPGVQQSTVEDSPHVTRSLTTELLATPNDTGRIFSIGTDANGQQPAKFAEAGAGAGVRISTERPSYSAAPDQRGLFNTSGSVSFLDQSGSQFSPFCDPQWHGPLHPPNFTGPSLEVSPLFELPQLSGPEVHEYRGIDTQERVYDRLDTFHSQPPPSTSASGATEPNETTVSLSVDPIPTSRSSRNNKRGLTEVSARCIICGLDLARLMLRGTKEQLLVPFTMLYLCTACADVAGDFDGQSSGCVTTGESGSGIGIKAETDAENPRNRTRQGGTVLKKRKRTRGDAADLMTCDVCLRDLGEGGIELIHNGETRTGFTIEIVCVRCNQRYKRCSDCGGGGGRLGLGKWRAKELFVGERKTCSLNHDRLPVLSDMEYAVWRVRDIPPDQGKDIIRLLSGFFRHYLLWDLAVPEVMETGVPMVSTYQEVDENVRQAWSFMEPTVLQDIEPTRRIRRYVGLRWAKPRPRKIPRAFNLAKTKPEDTITALNPTAATAATTTTATSTSTAEPNGDNSGHDGDGRGRRSIIRPGRELAGFAIAEWDIPNGSYFFLANIPFGISSGENYKGTRRLTMSMLTKVREDREREIRRIEEEGTEEERKKGVPVIRHSWTLLFHRRAGRLKRLQFLTLEEYLEKFPDTDRNMFPPYREVYLPQELLKGWQVIVRRLDEESVKDRDDRDRDEASQAMLVRANKLVKAKEVRALEESERRKSRWVLPGDRPADEDRDSDG